MISVGLGFIWECGFVKLLFLFGFVLFFFDFNCWVIVVVQVWCVEVGWMLEVVVVNVLVVIDVVEVEVCVVCDVLVVICCSEFFVVMSMVV